MNVEEIRKVVEKLNWRLPDEVQQDAYDVLLKADIDDTSLFIQSDMKYTWYNAVKLLSEIGYPKNKAALPRLIWLLSDVNWPGALEAIEILKNIDQAELIPLIRQALEAANDEKDTMWIGGIKQLIVEAKLQEILFSDESVSFILELADF